MSASLVGSEMCIRDRLARRAIRADRRARGGAEGHPPPPGLPTRGVALGTCLLYTSDAADDM
eukprot:3213197-Alexandrium_andersonii.AAC.1